MEDLVEGYIKQVGEYYKEMYITNIEEKWGVDLSAISAEAHFPLSDGLQHKTDKTVFVIVRLYGGGGSKLNETARSYKMLAEEARKCHRCLILRGQTAEVGTVQEGTLKKPLIPCSIFITLKTWKTGLLSLFS